MLQKMSIFTKIIILIAVLLLPVLLLYARSNFVSVNVVEQTLKNANREQLSFFVSQFDAAIQRLSASTTFLNRELNGLSVTDGDLSNPISDSFRDKLKMKLETQKLFASWDNELSVFFPRQNDIVSTNPSLGYDETYLQYSVKPNWQVDHVTVNQYNEYAFAYYEVYPFITSGQVKDAQYIIRIRFYERNIRNALNQFKASSIRDPFLFHPDYGVIGSSSMNAATTEELARNLRQQRLASSGISELTVNNNKYLVTYIQSKQLGWYVVDYVPLENILTPITTSRNYFYSCVAVLILLSTLAMFLLYRHVQVPIRELVHGVRRIEKGQYSSRIRLNTSSEFIYLFNSFNRMAAQIENLIETVLTEQIRSREATLKQLQSQINPHFLFNCLAFMMSMAKQQNYSAILSMAYSLSKYYRYTTRSETSFCGLRDELAFIKHYLDIQQMRMDRVCYEIDVPECYLDLQIPRLLLQPLVENALIHGIEPEVNAGYLRIAGAQNGKMISITVDDDGQGMDEQERDMLMKRLNGPLTEEMGCGVWNVNQRLRHQFGKEAGLHYEVSPYGGTRAVIVLPLQQQQTKKERRAADV
ncbi:sensor histidine kinase [Paenibacillus thalictri]|uniref:sensor histidine kinase n=1 Tax=Paenibacillus thalictri TaxID=2527873 RepID=UPI0013EF43CF|nr:histidine kinase [Paenibacillus thalictri]